MDREQHQQIIEQHIKNAIAAVFPYGEGRTTRPRVEHHLRKIAQYAHTEGQNSVLLNLLTVEDVAEQFGVTARRVRAIARNRHERFGIGWQVPGTNQWLFRPSEIETLRPDEKYRRK